MSQQPSMSYVVKTGFEGKRARKTWLPPGEGNVDGTIRLCFIHDGSVNFLIEWDDGTVNTMREFKISILKKR